MHWPNSKDKFSVKQWTSSHITWERKSAGRRKSSAHDTLNSSYSEWKFQIIILSTKFRIKIWQHSKRWYSKQLIHFYSIKVVNTTLNFKSNPLGKGFCKDDLETLYKGRQFLIIYVRWLSSSLQNHFSSALAGLQLEAIQLCSHGTPSPECSSACWCWTRIFGPSITSITRLSVLHCITTIYFYKPIDLRFGFVLLLYSGYFIPSLPWIIGCWLYEIWMLNGGLVPSVLTEVRVSWGYSTLCKIWI